MYDAILFPTDGSDAAEAATEQALGQAQAFDATLHLLYVVKSKLSPPCRLPSAA
jgi:nucleotide-binding universal stress UspA family protein